MQFGHLGTGTCVGWVIPAPELGITDHPVALFGQDPGARVIGRDTRAGLEFMLSLGLRQQSLAAEDRELIARLAAELDVHPTPEFGITTDRRTVTVPLEPAVPDGWRHEPGGSGIGVLAPADAFADWDRWPVDLLADAAELLDDGFPATALLALTDAFHDDHTQFSALYPLWARAYHDLDRSALAERLELMRPMYKS
jgi:hypothetical protein